MIADGTLQFAFDKVTIEGKATTLILVAGIGLLLFWLVRRK